MVDIVIVLIVIITFIFLVTYICLRLHGDNHRRAKFVRTIARMIFLKQRPRKCCRCMRKPPVYPCLLVGRVDSYGAVPVIHGPQIHGLSNDPTYSPSVPMGHQQHELPNVWYPPQPTVIAQTSRGLEPNLSLPASLYTEWRNITPSNVIWSSIVPSAPPAKN